MQYLQQKPSYSIRRINYVKVERSHPHTVQAFEHENHVDYWNITLNARSFLYRQIRRIVGALVAAAKGRITERDLYEMLTIPSKESFHKKIKPAPPNGLYLANIEFREKCLIPEQDVIVTNSSNDVEKPMLNESRSIN